MKLSFFIKPLIKFLSAMVFVFGFGLVANGALAAAPTMTAVTADSDNDGTIDQVVITFSEASDIIDGNAADGLDSIALTDSCTIAVGDYADDATTTLTLTLENCTSGDTSIVPTITYTAVASCATAGAICDDALANQMANAEDTVSVDDAAPIVTSVTPSSGASNLLTNDAYISITFSEAMDTGWVYDTEWSISPEGDDTQWGTAAWTNSDKTVTVTRARQFACATTYTVTTVHTEIDAAAGTTTALNILASEDGDWSFSTVGCGASSDGGTPSTMGEDSSYYLVITDPDVQGTYVAGDIMYIEWDNKTGEYDTINYVSIYYSTDDGSTYLPIEVNISNTGSYDWTVPDINAEVIIKVVGTDLVEELDSDVTDYAMIIGEVQEQDTVQEEDSSDHDGMAISPVTGEYEEVDTVNPGDYIRSYSFDSVYYVDEDMIRHPFMNSQTYFSWQDTFDSVKFVTDATLTTMSLGDVMLPKPGVVLVKIQSDPKVYAIEVNSENQFQHRLRHVPDEDTASVLYGANWADYIIDVPVTMWGHFTFSSQEMLQTENVATNTMRTRLQLSK